MFTPFYRNTAETPCWFTCHHATAAYYVRAISHWKYILVTYVKCPFDMVCWYSMYDAELDAYKLCMPKLQRPGMV